MSASLFTAKIYFPQNEAAPRSIGVMLYHTESTILILFLPSSAAAYSLVCHLVIRGHQYNFINRVVITGGETKYTFSNYFICLLARCMYVILTCVTCLC